MSIEDPEWERLERKESFGAAVSDAVGAFCNTHGGVIEVGVRDDGTPTGALTVGGRTLEDWANQIKRNTDPGQTPSIQETERDGRTIVKIRVNESPLKPVMARGRALKRVGRTNQAMGHGEVRRLIEESSGDSWDSHPCRTASLDDISDEAVMEFVEEAREQRARSMDGTPEQVLEKMMLVKEKIPTFAGILLFGEDPQGHLPQSVVKCARFAGKTSTEFIDEQTLYGSVFKQIEEAHAFALRHISKRIEMTGEPRREERWQYPPEAVRELIINAICHRDYQSTGNVQLRIYDDRLEVWTPGGLPAGITADELRREHSSQPRNPKIAEALFHAGYIEQWGTGTLRVIEQCAEAGLPGPEFEDGGSTFVARMRLMRYFSEQDLLAAGMNERQVRGIMYAQEHGEIRNATYCEINEVSRSTATSELGSAVEADFLRAVGEGRARRYVVSLGK